MELVNLKDSKTEPRDRKGNVGRSEKIDIQRNFTFGWIECMPARIRENWIPRGGNMIIFEKAVKVGRSPLTREILNMGGALGSFLSTGRSHGYKGNKDEEDRGEVWKN
jgi:hypothetical protein